jgi:hypothetical protein
VPLKRSALDGQEAFEPNLEGNAARRRRRAVRLRRADLGLAVLDVVEGEIELVRVPFGAAELAAVIGEHGFDRQVELLVERQDVVVQHGDRRLGLLGDVQEAEGVGAVGVDHGLQVDATEALKRADHR